MLNMECPSTITLSVNPEITFQEYPTFEISKAIPSWAVPQIEAAVKDFIETSHSCEGVDPTGFYYQTLESIANSTVLGGSGDFWLGTDSKGVCAYAIARVVKDIDNKLTYWCSQSWMRKDIRGLEWYRYGMDKIKERAKATFCSHIVIVSSRNAKAYLRFLGKNWHEYATLLKEDICSDKPI